MLLVAGVVLAAALWGNPSQADEPTYPLVDAVQRAAILRCMQAVGLESDSLAALNVNAEQAEVVVATCRTWYFANQATLGSAQADLAAACETYSVAATGVRQGNTGNEALAAAQSALLEAETARDAVLGNLRAAVASQLSSSQRALWQVMEHGHGQSLPRRLLALTDEQDAELAGARRHLRGALANAEDGGDRTAARANWHSAVAEVLTDDHETMLEAYRGYVAASHEAVRAAIATVLALNEEA